MNALHKDRFGATYKEQLLGNTAHERSLVKPSVEKEVT